MVRQGVGQGAGWFLDSMPMLSILGETNSFYPKTSQEETIYPEVRGHCVFGLEVKERCGNTADLFSWSDTVWLVLCR